ncbi:MAG: hypothetical protein KJN63_11130 [Acidimicrobiia bacterium]|nr:hypothetical protein [Acidimicrobiia bacterium]
MEVEQADFAHVVQETKRRAQSDLSEFDHPLELDRRINAALDAARSNSHTRSIESHPGETTKNKAGQLARRLALNPGDQRRLNRELVSLLEDLDQRTRRHEAELAKLTAQVDRLLALRRSGENP